MGDTLNLFSEAGVPRETLYRMLLQSVGRKQATNSPRETPPVSGTMDFARWSFGNRLRAVTGQRKPYPNTGMAAMTGSLTGRILQYG